jgi:hypothetical protein
MPIYPRLGGPALGPDGNTVEQDIRLHNSAHLEIRGGDSGLHFKLKFANAGAEGWWVDQPTLRQLITELLYVYRDIEFHYGSDEQPVGMPDLPANNPPVEGEEPFKILDVPPF